MTLAPFTVRPYRPGDEYGILRLFNDVFAVGNPDFVPRPLDHWQWAFRDNPLSHHTFVAEAEGRIVGNYTAMPQRWRTPDGILVGSQALDSCVAPEYRRSLKKTGLFLQLAGDWFDHYGRPDRDVLVYGFPNPQAFRVGTRLLDYRPVRCPVPELSLPLAAFRTAGESVRAVSLRERFDESIDALDAKHTKPLSCVRDHRYLNWRYVDCPTADYRPFVAESASGEPLGWLITTLGWHGDRKNLVPLVDWSVAEGDLETWRALLRAAAADAGGRTDLDTFLAWAPPWHHHWAELQGLGFEAAESRFNLCIRVFHPCLSVPYAVDHWYVLMGDSDIY